MPRSRVAVEIIFNHFDQIAAKTPKESGQIVQETLFDIETAGKLRCPVDTGALRASIANEMETQTSGVVYTDIEYSTYVEFGTVKMAARPYLTPAAEAARSGFIRKMQDLESRLA